MTNYRRREIFQIFDKFLPQRIALSTILTVFLLMILIGCASQSQQISYKSASGEFIWPPPPETPRIKWLGEWSSKEDFGKPNPFMTFLLGSEGRMKMRRATDVVADSQGNIYATDAERAMIFVFDREKNAFRVLGEGLVSAPIGLAIDNKRGILFVSDTKLEKVFGIDKNSGRIMLVIGGPSDLKNPSGMVYDEKRERLYVSDTQHHKIKVYDKDGKSLMTIGQKGEDDGEFSYPSYLALDRSGKLYVVDSFNFRVQIFDSNGKFIQKFGRLGDAPGYFSRPAGIGVDSEEHIYIADTSFNNFQIFNSQGQLLLFIGENGKQPGQFSFPQGLFVDQEDKIYVADTFNSRVQVFQYLKGK